MPVTPEYWFENLDNLHFAGVRRWSEFILGNWGILQNIILNATLERVHESNILNTCMLI